MTEVSYISLEPLHNAAMIRQELSAMAGEPGAVRLTMRGFVRLCLSESPFVSGGDVTYAALSEAREALGARNASPDDIAEAVATALRPLECLGEPPDDTFDSRRDRGICPEWLCDIYAAVCRVAPATTWEAFMDALPLAGVMHLVCAARRAQGGHTERPVDYGAALRGLNSEEKE